MLRCAALLLLLLGPTAVVRAVPASDLAPLFDAAARDPERVPELLVAASRALGAMDGERALLLADTLEPYCRRAFFGPERWSTMGRLGLELHTVRSGELPGTIARTHGIGAGLLGYLNDGYEERRLRVGQVLKVVDLDNGDLELVVERARYRLMVWRRLPDEPGRVLMACMPVGLGAVESPTPAGRTTITKRVLDPAWTHPVTRRVHAPDDPENVLGGYWIALDERGLGKSGIGLHGFTGDAPDNWIERPASNGCVRLLQPDVDRVFHLALEGTAVAIQ
jgi:hypothetical protein